MAVTELNRKNGSLNSVEPGKSGSNGVEQEK